MSPGHDDKGNEHKSYDYASNWIEHSSQSTAFSHLYEKHEYNIIVKLSNIWSSVMITWSRLFSSPGVPSAPLHYVSGHWIKELKSFEK